MSIVLHIYSWKLGKLIVFLELELKFAFYWHTYCRNCQLGFSSVSARKLKCPSLAWLVLESSQLGLARAGKFQLELISSNHFWYKTDSIWGRVVPLIFQGSIYFNDRDIFREKNNDFQNMTWCAPIIWSPNDQNLTTRFKFIGIKWSSAEGADWLCCWMGGPSQYIH